MSAPIGVSRYGAEVSAAIDRLDLLSPGELISYDDLSEAAGVDVRQYRVVYQTALKRLMKDSGKVYAVVHGLGIKLLPSEDVVKTGVNVVSKIRRAAKKGIARATTVNYEELTSEGRVSHSVQLTVLSLIEHGTKRSSMKAISVSVSGKDTALLLKDTLALLA